MALLPIVKGKDNKILRTVSDPVRKFDSKLGKLLDDMKDTMIKAHGVGLAAPQIGLNIRAVVCRFNYDTPHELIVDMINPEITGTTDDMIIHEEGCLSIPGKYDEVARHEGLTVKFLDRKGRPQVLKLKGFNARIVQHEVDHINAKLYVDRVEPKV